MVQHMTGQPIRLGIIGAGIMGERMLRAALEQEGPVAITAIWDAAAPALDRLAPVLDGLHQVRAASAAAVLEASDCVYVATPPATHLHYAAQALAAGRAVFLEKPLATDTAAAETFTRAHAGGRVAVNFPFASSFAVERLRGWLDEGAVSPTCELAIRVAFRAWPRPWQHAAASWLDARAEGGFTREVVSHFLFLTRRLLAKGIYLEGTPRLRLESASATFVDSGRSERSISARLMVTGIPVSLEGSVGGTEADDHNTWTLSSPTPGGVAIRLRDWSWAERRRPDGTWAADPDAAPNERMRPLVLRRQLAGVAAMTRGEQHQLATLEEAFEVQEIVEAILAKGSTHA